MSKILFIIKSYPPRQSANVQCDAKVIKALADGEHEIHCLVSKFHHEESEESMDGIFVHRVDRGAYWNKYTFAREHEDAFSWFILKADRVLMRFKQFLAIPIYPVYEPFLLRKFAKKAISLHKKEHFDIVISEFHGMESLHAGRMLKQYDRKIRFLPILWDPFVGKTPAKYLPPKFAERRIMRAAERELGPADMIIGMESSKTYYEERKEQISYYGRMRFLDIPGIVRPAETTIKSKYIIKDKINIVYAGLLTLPDRDPEYIIEALAQTSLASDMHMVFFCAGEGKQKLKTLQERFPGKITVSGYVEKEELVATYHEADVLLNLGGPNSRMVPSKIFEYLSYGKPIISTYYMEGEASLEYLNRYPLATCIDQRRSLLESGKKLESFLSNKLSNIIPFDAVFTLYGNNTPQKYIEMIDQLRNSDHLNKEKRA